MHSERQLRNLVLHKEHLHAIGKGSKRLRKQILSEASPELVEALSTAIRLLHESGATFAPYHLRRASRLMSRNTAKRTKKVLVSGKEGKGSRGATFFKDVANGVASLPELSIQLLIE